MNWQRAGAWVMAMLGVAGVASVGRLWLIQKEVAAADRALAEAKKHEAGLVGMPSAHAMRAKLYVLLELQGQACDEVARNTISGWDVDAISLLGDQFKVAERARLAAGRTLIEATTAEQGAITETSLLDLYEAEARLCRLAEQVPSGSQLTFSAERVAAAGAFEGKLARVRIGTTGSGMPGRGQWERQWKAALASVPEAANSLETAVLRLRMAKLALDMAENMPPSARRAQQTMFAPTPAGQRP